MQVIHDYALCPQSAHHCVVALGNFDGVHLGHQKVIQRAIDVSQQSGNPSAVMTFDPHPICVLRPETPPFQLGNLASKTKLIEELGIDYLFVIPFTEEFSKLPAHIFVEKILLQQLHASHIITGQNFIFGFQRTGTPELLTQLSQQHAFQYEALQPVGTGDTTYSSSLVREHLSRGELENVRNILGRPYSISGTVIQGDQRGRTLGYPTVNIDLGLLMRPAYGVYAVRVSIQDNPSIYHGVANLGIRPTYGDDKALLEVHLFDFQQNIYNHHLDVELVQYIRPEKTFASPEDLKAAIEQDCQSARDIL